jgi:aspartokinase
VAARIFGALQAVNVKLITYGGAGVNLTVVVADSDVPTAVKSLHQELCATGNC